MANQTYYVAIPADGGNDNNNGSQGAPFATWQKAVDTAKPIAGNHTVYVKTGTYAPSAKLLFTYTGMAYTSILFIGTDANWIEAASAAAGPLLACSNASYCVHLEWAQYANTLKFKKLRISNSSSKAVFYAEGDDNEGDTGIEMTDCTMISGKGFFNQAGGYNFINATRAYKFTRVAFDATGMTTGWMLSLGSATSIVIDHCNVSGNHTCTGFIDIESHAPNIGSVQVTDNSGSVGGIFLNTTVAAIDYATTNFNVSRNTVICKTKFMRWAPPSLTTKPTITVNDNDVTCLFSTSSDLVMIGDGESECNDYGTVQILRNVLRWSGCTGGTNHGILIGRGCVSGEIAYNRVLNDGGEETYALVCKGDNVCVHHNIARSKWVIVCSCGNNKNIHHNSVYVDVVDGAGIRVSRHLDDTTFPEYNLITDNLIHGGIGGASGYAVSWAHYTTGATDTVGYKANRLDRNLYYKGTDANLASLNNATPEDLAALQAQWVTYGNAGNDVLSHEADLVYVDISTNDFRIKSTSPAITYGRQSTPVGAWGYTPVLPDVLNVLNGVGYGLDGTEFVGVVELPAVSVVKHDISFGANGTQYTGTYNANGALVVTAVVTAPNGVLVTNEDVSELDEEVTDIRKTENGERITKVSTVTIQKTSRGATVTDPTRPGLLGG